MNSSSRNWPQMLNSLTQQNPYNTPHPPHPSTLPQNAPFSKPINQMYSSAIQPQITLLHPQEQSLLAFEKIGRFVKDEIDEGSIQRHAKVMEGVRVKGEPLSFRKGKNGREKKMSWSSIFPSHKTPTSNVLVIGKNKENVTARSKLQALMGNKKILEAQEEYFPEPQQRNRPKEEGNKIAIKLASHSANEGGNKIYFQLPSRKKPTQPPLTQGTFTMPLGKTDVNIPLQGTFKKKAMLCTPSLAAKETKEKEVLKKSDFAFGKRMGKGQFGEVMMAVHRLTGFLCGVKVMSKRQIREQRYVEQVARQLKIQFYLEHRFIAPLYGYFQDQESIYLLVEFCTEGQLFQKLRKARQLEEDQLAPIVREVCQGLSYIHQEQIIHRDIKPENILFQFGTVKISDFGWAVYANNRMRRTVSGTPLYYSPELVLEKDYDEKIDIWSVGMMTYECLLGRIPFRIYSQRDLRRIVEDEITYPQYVDISPQAKDFILNTMKKNPQERMEVIDLLRHPFLSERGEGRRGAWEQLG